MPFHISFTFGVGSSFNFSFAMGTPAVKPAVVPNVPQSPPAQDRATSALQLLTRPTRNMTHANLMAEASNVIDNTKKLFGEHYPGRANPFKNLQNTTSVLTPEPKQAQPCQNGPSPILAVTHCPLFSKIPIEVRDIIYRHVLVSSEPISRAHELIGYKTLVANNYHPIPDIDARILQTCRLIYEETLPILYGKNTFRFDNPNSMSLFSNEGLTRYPSNFDFKPAPYGRLTLLRTVHVKFTAHPAHLFGLGGNPNQPDRDYVWSDWSRTLFSERRNDNSHAFGGGPLGLPALEKLTLDLTDWHLTEDEALMVRPIIRTLKDFPKLKWLAIKGVSHQPTLDKLREGFGKGGPNFFQVVV